MEPNNINVKPEPPFTSLSSGVIYPLSVNHNPGKNHPSSLCTVLQKDSYSNTLSVCMPQMGFPINDNLVLSSQTKVEFFESESDSSHNCLEDNSNVLSVHSLASEFQVPNLPSECVHKHPAHTTAKPSEALFVRALIGRCKRIAPLWFRGVSSMRERNREENRRMACNSGQSQSDWSLIALKIAEMNANTETDAVSNLLKKLYKELPSDSVFWFLKCWLGSEDTLKDPDSCVISRGDAKGRMRRIDGGKGSDKVWRLDTIVGMLYHGLPMSSTDTNIMMHTCDHELCVRPQHIRFRASSVALVVVLKALTQAGYTIIPPTISAGPNGISPNASDESVDVFGPFSIEELQQYRSENLNPASESMSKLTLSATDRELVDMVPVIKDALQQSEISSTPVANLNRVNSLPNSYMSYTNYHKSHKLDLSRESSAMSSSSAFSPSSINNDSRHSPIRRISNGFTSAMTTSKLNATNCCLNNNISGISDSGSTTTSSNATPHTTTVCSKENALSPKSERYSLKRPPPDSPSSFPSSPAKLSYNFHPSSSPPLLISEVPPSSCNRTTQIHPQIRRPSDSTLITVNSVNTSGSLSCSNNNNNNNNSKNSSAFYAVSMQDNANSLQQRSLQSTIATTTNMPISNNGIMLPRPLDSSHSMTNGGGYHRSMSHQPHHHQFHHQSDQQIISQQHHQQQNHAPFTSLSCSPPHLHHQQTCSMQQNQRNAVVSKENNPFLCTHPYLGLLVSSGPMMNGLCAHTPPINSSTSGNGSGGGSGGGNIPLLLSSSGCSSSGKSTPRQPAKKRPEARTPTIDGSCDEMPLGSGGGGGSGGGPSSSNTLSSICNFDDSHSHLSTSSLESTTNTFMVHHNTPFVPVHGRSGRPSSTELIHPSLGGYINSNPGSNSLSSSSSNSSSSSSSASSSSSTTTTLTSTTTAAAATTTSSIMTTTTNSLNNSPGKQISDNKYQMAIMTTGSNRPNHHQHHLSSTKLDHRNTDEDEEEAEMDQELVDIMVGLNGGVGGGGGGGESKFPFSSSASHSNNLSIGGQHQQQQQHPLMMANNRHQQHHLLGNDIGASPDGRRVIAAMVAALANVSNSPLLDGSTPINPRRSVSACSLPRFDISPNDDFVDLISHTTTTTNTTNNNNNNNSSGHSTRLSSSLHLFSQLNHNQHNQHQQINHSLPMNDGLNTTAAITTPTTTNCNQKVVDRRLACCDDDRSTTPPPPKLLSSTAAMTASCNPPLPAPGELCLSPKFSTNTNCTVNHINNNSNNNNGEYGGFSFKDSASSPQESMQQELATLLRNSPASGISQELIDMLANMAQQYGMQQSRTGSRASRPSSQVAQHFYRSLVNGSVCGSPFSSSMTGGGGGASTPSSGFNFLHTNNNNNSSGDAFNTISGGHILTPFNGLNSCSTVHHLRNLSFTPLSIDADTCIGGGGGGGGSQAPLTTSTTTTTTTNCTTANQYSSSSASSSSPPPPLQQPRPLHYFSLHSPPPCPCH
ncbi:unnamed protein product [Trichobilharzia szidati]|nr:unnamed protein product [Trichobilharzia szidati]